MNPLRPTLLALVVGSALVPSLHAATIDVGCTAGTKEAELIAAFAAVEANAEAANTINLTADCVYTFAVEGGREVDPGNPTLDLGGVALPPVSRPHTLVVNGNGATIERSSVGGTPDFRLLQFGDLNGAPPAGDMTVTLNNLSLRNGRLVQATTPGGYVYAYGGGLIFRGDPGDTLRLNAVRVVGNEAESGGGLVAQSFSGGFALDIVDAEFRDNIAHVSGAGLQLENPDGGSIASTLFDGNVLNPAGITPPGFGPDPTRGEAGAAGLACYGCRNLVLSDLIVSNNTANGIGGGGMVLVGGQVRIERSRIESNHAQAFAHGPSVGAAGGRKGEGGDGGGLVVAEGFFTPVTLDLVDSAILNNTASRRGGGLATAGENEGALKSVIRVANSTFSGNTAGFAAGGLAIGGGEVSLINVTVTGNSAQHAGGVGVGHYNYDGILFTDPITPLVTVGSARFVNTVIGGNTSTNQNPPSDDCAVEENTVADGGGVIENASSLVRIDAPDLAPVVDHRCGATYPFALVADPKLGPLADNGGPDRSHLPLFGSPVIDAGDASLIPADLPLASDQRGPGFVRVFGPAIDLGSIEISDPRIFANGFEAQN